MSAVADAVAELLEVVSVLPGEEYAWFGRRFSPAPGAQGLEARLTRRLYGDFFCTGGPVPSSDERAHGPRQLTDAAFRSSLSEANQSRACRQQGWTIVAHEGVSVIIERDGLRLFAAAEDLGDGKAQSPPGSRVTLASPAERTGASPGFHTALGEAELDQAVPPSGIDRHYWSLRSTGAAALVRELTERLNRNGTPFRLKVVDSPEHYGRCDAGVLYTLPEDRPGVRRIAEEVRERLAPHLRARIPVFTLPLAPGVAFAEDPGGDESFGWSRCRILAGGLVLAHQRGATTTAARAEVIEEAFTAAGIDVRRPYLDPRSRDRERVGVVA